MDQAAYRQGFSTEDHLISLTLLLKASAQWNVPLWLGLVDFEKTFDSVEHALLWEALRELGVGAEYVDLLKIGIGNRRQQFWWVMKTGHLHWSVVPSKVIP